MKKCLYFCCDLKITKMLIEKRKVGISLITCFFVSYFLFSFSKTEIKAEKTDINITHIKKHFKQTTIFSNKKIKEIHVTKKGIDLIKKFETLSLKSYRLKGETSNTIGWGHKINSKDPLWLRQKYIGYSITEKEADEILDKDIKTFVEPAMQKMYYELDSCGVKTEILTSDFWDGLASLIYNCGPTGIKKSEFYNLLKRNRIKIAIKKIPETHVYCEGHKNRRNEEMGLMLKIYA